MAHSSSMKLLVLSLSAVLLASCGGASSSSSPSSASSSSYFSSSTTVVSSSQPSVSSSVSELSSAATAEESSEVTELSSEESEGSEEESTEDSSIVESTEESSSEESSVEESTEESSEESSAIESSEEVNRQIDADVWKAIIEGGSMTDRNSNYTCTMTKSMKEIENVSTSTFFVSSGNLQRSMPASYNPSIIVSEYYGLIEWGNPTSRYRHYTYNGAEEKWEGEELNSKFLHFYRDDLGILIDLTLDDLSFDEANGYYYCKKKVSYCFDSPSIGRVYENIKIQFNNGRLDQIQYDSQGAAWVFDYSAYGETFVTLPIVAG